jgi:aspartyl-tRNA(Asn)/glutamyl-tRNA(Gln) amidotransferase subunit A
MQTVAALSARLAAGRTTSRALVEEALARIADPAGEGARTFIKVSADLARAEADASDRYRKAGIVRSAVDGLPISLKDLFDIGGEVTRAGSKALRDEPPAAVDAPVVARLRAAGAVAVGRTNMVEFAFGGIGINPHFGTPRNPWDRGTGRVPGGSSSGAAVSVTDGMCVMGLGSDTRGSVRMPAALCGLAGFKPTARRVPREGVFPLSYTLDSVGPLAPSIACCATFDAILAGETANRLPDLPIKGLRLLVPQSLVLEALDEHVARAFEAALSRLSASGAVVTTAPVPAFDRHDEYFRNGGFSGAEAVVIHKPWQERFGEYDRRVAQRITLGKNLSATDYVELIRMRTVFQQEVRAASATFDAMVMPAVSCVAPTIAEVDASDDAYFAWNGRFTRNCGLINFLDGCAATVPCHEPGSAPVGFMVCGNTLADSHVLAVAHAVERLLGPTTQS